VWQCNLHRGGKRRGCGQGQRNLQQKVLQQGKSAKLAKLVKLAKSTDLWCLSPFVPLTQEAKAKQRKVYPVNLRGEVCTANNLGSKHPKVCIVADHGKGKIPKATCALWHVGVPFAGKTQGNFTGRRSGPNPPPAARGARAARPRPGWSSRTSTLPSLRRWPMPRIRAAKMMLQGVTYSQVVGRPVVPP
jgi:hypothetical protein